MNIPIYDKRAFIVQYVLNRASAAPRLDGEAAVTEAIRAWEKIEAACQSK